jgi:hypothetical protein
MKASADIVTPAQALPEASCQPFVSSGSGLGFDGSGGPAPTTPACAQEPPVDGRSPRSARSLSGGILSTPPIPQEAMTCG